MNDTINLECVFCGVTVPCNTDEDFDAAMDAGWTPSFIYNGRTIEANHCGDCAAVHTTCNDPEGEPVLLPGHEQCIRPGKVELD